MRVTQTTPGLGDIGNQGGGAGETMPALNPALKAPLGGMGNSGNGGNIQFGTAFTVSTLKGPPAGMQNPPITAGANNDTLQSLFKQFADLILGKPLPGSNSNGTTPTGGNAPAAPAAGTKPAAPAAGTTPATPTQGASETQGATKTDNSTALPKATPAPLLDNSKYSSPEELKKYDALVAHLPPNEREQAAKELNRPIAAAKMAAAGGEEGKKAMEFIKANPALEKALDTSKHGGKADGKISKNDFSSFIKNMDKATKAAGKDIEEYQKKNPDADPQSLAMVHSAAMLRANEPLVKAGEKDTPDDRKPVDKYITDKALKGMQDGNSGLSLLARQTAKTFAEPGFLHMLDQGGFEGEGLALHNADKKISTKNIDEWIKKQAPKTGGEFASMMSDAATRNAVAKVDISNLNEDVFNNPGKYSGEQKAAVMIKLQETQEQVEGGSKLRKVGKTSEALQQKIAQLQMDPDVKTFMDKAVPQQQNAMLNSDPALKASVEKRNADLVSGKALQDDMATAEKQAEEANKGKKPEDRTPVDYSKALGGLNAELQMQGELSGNKTPMTAAQVLDKRPDLKAKINQSYQESFVQGKAVEGALKKDQKSDAKDVLGQVDSQKMAYDEALGTSVTAAAQSGYAEATMKALTTTGKGASVLKDLKDAGTLPKDADTRKMTGAQMYGQLRDSVEKQTSAAGLSTTGKLAAAGGGAFSVASLLTINQKLKDGDTSGAIKGIYDGAKGAGELGKLGYNAAAQALGKDASAGLGRIAGAAAGRIAGMVAGEAAGLAAASAIGAAAGPIGWAIDAIMAIGFGIKAIVDAVNKHKRQETFDHNVDPTLKQFGIPKAH